MGGYSGVLGGTVAGGITSDALGAVPVTKAGDKSPTLVDGTVINPGMTTPRQHIATSCVIVLLGAFLLLGGARFLRNARIA